MRLGALMADEIKSQLLGSPRTVPKTILEHGRQAVDLIAAVQRFSGWFKITWFPLTEVSASDLTVDRQGISAIVAGRSAG
jgi:hypothetical protein